MVFVLTRSSDDRTFKVVVDESLSSNYEEFAFKVADLISDLQVKDYIVVSRKD